MGSVGGSYRVKDKGSRKVAVGTWPGMLSSFLLFTLESLIGKAMSPGCECVIMTGVEVASAGEKGGLGGQ